MSRSKPPTRPSSIDRARLKRPSRPFAALSLPHEVLAEWRPIHRVVQYALAIVAASDAKMRAAAVWPGEQPEDLTIVPGLTHAAEGGVAIQVVHKLRPSEAFGGPATFLDSRTTRTEFRLFTSSVYAKDGDYLTWHRTAFRMAELVEEYATAFAAARGASAEARARAAGRALSGLNASAYRAAERAIERRDANGDQLWGLLGV